MINTVTGMLEKEKLGVTLMHEHIIWDWEGTGEERRKKYSIENVVNTMLPYLLDLKNVGCSTLLEATTDGAGRDVKVLRECSKQSGLNIITNVGAWDGGQFHGKLVPQSIREMDADAVAYIWKKEFYEGIEGSGIKPGFIKLALGDEGYISDFHEKLVRAAARASKKTGLTIQCHVCSSNSIKVIAGLIREEGLSYNKFIWVHADASEDVKLMTELGKEDMWIEIDCFARTKDFSYHIDLLKALLEADLTRKLLISQDAGTFNVGMDNNKDTIHPYDRIFKEFIPLCNKNGIENSIFDIILMENPKNIFV